MTDSRHILHARSYEEKNHEKLETGGLIQMMNNSTISIPEAMKNKAMGNVRLVD